MPMTPPAPSMTRPSTPRPSATAPTWSTPSRRTPAAETTASSTRAVFVENDPPQTTIDSGPPASSDDTSPTFTFSSSEGASSFECRIDGGAFASCDSPYSPGDLALGRSRLRGPRERCRLQHGPDAGLALLRDRAARPTPRRPRRRSTAGRPRSSTDTSPAFEFSSSESGSTFECRLDSAAFAACQSPYAPGELDFGDHVFEVRATDASGNTDASPASVSFRISEPPPLEITMGAVNMTPTGRINLPVACPARCVRRLPGASSASGSGPACRTHTTTLTTRTSRSPATARRPTATSAAAAASGARSSTSSPARPQRVPMNVGRNARNRACRQGKLTVDVIVRHRVGDEWELATSKLVLRPQRCRSN